MKGNHSKHLELSNVECANKDCRKENGLHGNGPRKRIKQKFIDQLGTEVPHFCYKCGKALKGSVAKAMAAGR